MDTVTERSHAKLNLSLDILSKREDGYHDLKTVMCSVEFGDDVPSRFGRTEERFAGATCRGCPETAAIWL